MGHEFLIIYYLEPLRMKQFSQLVHIIWNSQHHFSYEQGNKKHFNTDTFHLDMSIKHNPSTDSGITLGSTKLTQND